MKRKHLELTSEWIENWRPTQIQEVSDRGAKGLVLRSGSTGIKVFYVWNNERDTEGKARRRRVRLGVWPMLSLASARKMVHERRETRSLGSPKATVGDLLDVYIERGQVSAYTAGLLRKHLEPVRPVAAAALAPVVLSDLVARVQAGYEDKDGRHLGGPAVADKVRSGLQSLFGWAQRQGRFPSERPLPTLGLVREDFKGIGWTAKDRVPSERELHELLDALGIGTGERIEVDEEKSPRISRAARLATLLVMHVPVRSGAGVLSQPTEAADLKRQVLQWSTRKGTRDADLETPLSGVALEILKQLRELKGGGKWLVPSPEDPKKPIGLKALSRVFARLQSPAPDGELRVRPDKGQDPFTPHSLRALWTTLAGEIGVDDGVAVRVIGHKPEGASKAHTFYDKSLRVDKKREAVERVSAELERIRRRQPAAAADVVPLQAPVRGMQ